MALEPPTVRRLAFIKYLWKTAVSQSEAPVPLKFASILTMHDAVELFLQLSSEQLDAGTKRPEFMQYWELLDPKLAPNRLSQKESMRRLNKARVALKHHGTFPSALDVEAFRGSVTSFFAENTPLVFGVEFDDVSLDDFVSPASARASLKKARTQIESGDILPALQEIALAFTDVVTDYERRKLDSLYRSPFYFGPPYLFPDSRFTAFGEVEVSEFSKYACESIMALQQAVKILALGLDYRKYSKFRYLTPSVVPTAEGEYAFGGRGDESHEPSAEEARFCIDFVIESSLALAEFDYTIEGEKK